MERSGVLLTTQFGYWKCLGTCHELLCASHTLQSALESEQEVRTMQIVQPLIGPTIREFTISSFLWVLGTLCCLY